MSEEKVPKNSAEDALRICLNGQCERCDFYQTEACTDRVKHYALTTLEATAAVMNVNIEHIKRKNAKVTELQKDIEDLEHERERMLKIINEQAEQMKEQAKTIEKLEAEQQPRVCDILDLMDKNWNDDDVSIKPHTFEKIRLRFQGPYSDIGGLYTNHPIMRRYADARIEQIGVSDNAIDIWINNEDW